MARRTKKTKKYSTVWVFILLLVLTIATGVLAVFASGSEVSVDFDNILSTFKPVESSVETPEVVPEVVPEAPVIVPQREMPSEMRAVTIKAGREFSLDGDTEEIKSEIDLAISQALEMTMNTLVIDPVSEDGIRAYNSTTLESGSYELDFSPVSYAIETAQSKGLYTAVIYNITENVVDDQIITLAQSNNLLIDNLTSQLDEFLMIADADMILLDAYYNVSKDTNYLDYINSGSGIGMQTHMEALPFSYIEVASETIKLKNRGTNIGLLTEAVWANSYEHEDGSLTAANFSALIEGNTDTIAILEKGLADFIAIKASGSTEDKSIPYEQVISWWDEQLTEMKVPMYIIHSSDKAATENVGWTEYEQLIKQVILAESTSYKGSIFNDLARLVEDPKNSTTKLIGYYAGTVKSEHVFTDLEISVPAKTKFVSYDDKVMFSGNTDPNTEATINGVDITTDENGYFSIELPLEEGKNQFVIDHKGKTLTYVVTRIIEVVKEVTPTGTLEVDGATKLTITAIAYADADVYAIINGSKIPLTLSKEDVDESLRNTPYRLFTGVYTVPDSTTSVQNLGKLEVFGVWGEYKKSKDGATILIKKRTLPSDGMPVVVTSQWAETFPGNTLNHYSDPTYFPLPQGALDYAVGTPLKYSYNNDGKIVTNSYYKLASGLRVFTDDISAVSVDEAPVENKITGVTVESDERYTTITLAMSQQVSYVARYDMDYVTFDFQFTNSVPDGMRLTKNPIFSNLSFEKSKMILTLAGKNKFFGLKSWFDNSGNLVIEFNNPPEISGSSLDNVKIVIDPGHGGNDPGAAGYALSHPEKVINWAIVNDLSDILEDKGADVVVLQTINNNIPLKQRVKMAVDEDPHLFVSVHSNSFRTNEGVSGSEAYYFTPYSFALADISSKNVAKALNTIDRGEKFGYFYVTRNTQFPSVLVETGFLTNRNEYSKLVDGSYQYEVAEGIANSVSTYFKAMGATSENATGSQISGSMN